MERVDDDHVDHVDEIVAQWGRERPDLDVSGMEVIGRISRMERAMRAHLDAVFARHDLESWEFDVLATLRRHGPPFELTPGRLLESTMVTSGAMTNRLDRLERRGLVVRSKSPTDGRQVLVTLTEDGRRVVDAAVTEHAANELEMIAVLDAGQRAELVEIMRLLQRHLDALRRD